jgi:hypothetical protein
MCLKWQLQSGVLLNARCVPSYGIVYGAITVTVALIQECGENPKFHLYSQWNSETHLLPVCSALETSTRNPSVLFCDNPLTFWAPSTCTIFCTLIFLSQQMNCGLRHFGNYMMQLSSCTNLREFLLQFSEKDCQRSKMAYCSFVHHKHQSSLWRIHGTTLSHFVDS